MDYQRDEHRVHLIVYHLVWTPKRRKAVLKGAVAGECRTLLETKCAEKGWHLLDLAINPDHIHLFVRVPPSVSAAEVIRHCKGLTSHQLRRKFPSLKRFSRAPASVASRATKGPDSISSGTPSRMSLAMTDSDP